METSPLTLAHAHARNAVLETKRSNPVAASEEHDLAAAEFAAAAQSTTDGEALRLLNLLEQHHKKLGQILKARHHAPQEASQTNQPSKSAPADAQPPRLVKTGRRDLSTSITSNLASARGIPSGRQRRSTPISPLVSNQHADGRFAEERLKQEETPKPVARPSWAPPADVTSDKQIVDTTVSDAPFQQFYATFEGLMSKLSAPLAFAGLPLLSPQQSQPKAIKQRAAEALQSSIDYSQLISRAALRAVRNDQPGHNPSESFYVVPTTGGTTSYAEIMSRADREERTFRDHGRNLSNVSNDDFVDASSTILSPSRTKEKKHNGKTMEELSLENQALKHLSDTLSKRLHVFEMSAQTSSAALAQSIRSLHLSPLSTPENSRGKSKSGTTIAFSSDQIHGQSAADAQKLNTRIAELEEILKKADARTRKKEEENAKLRDMLTKYREKWDNLKAGAKARREKQGETSTGAGIGSTPRKRDRDRDGDGGEGKNEGIA